MTCFSNIFEKVAYILGLQVRLLWGRVWIAGPTRAGMDIHRRHRSSLGTPCADPMNSKSMSLTQRGDTYTGTLRQHDTLGVCTYSSFGSAFVTLPYQVPGVNLYSEHHANNSVIIV